MQLKDYELKIDNLKLAMENTNREFPGISLISYSLTTYLDPKELDIKISQLDDEIFHFEQLISKKKNENDNLIMENTDKKVYNA